MYTLSFEILKKRLQETVPELRIVDWYMDQDNNKDKNVLITDVPAAYIRFYPSTMEQLGRKIQASTSEFEVILLTENMAESGSLRLRESETTDHMTLLSKINSGVSGFGALKSYLTAFENLKDTPNDQRVMNTITRVGVEVPHVMRSIMKSIQRFQVRIWDHSAHLVYSPALPSPELDIEVEIIHKRLFTADSTLVFSDSTIHTVDYNG